MKKHALYAAGAALLCGCATQQPESITFRDGRNYFVRNDVEEIPLIIDNEAERDSVLGTAPVMGDGGLPTEIDFTQEALINIALPETNCPTEIKIEKVERTADSLVVSFKAIRSQEASYTMLPYAMAIVRKDAISGTKGVKVVEVK